MEQQALLAAIRANPDDHIARLVYADWLDERGDSLAEYVRAECELMTQEPGSSAWEDALQQLRDICKLANRNFGGWEYAPELSRMREKLERLRDLDVGRAVFGAGGNGFGHRYVFEPPPNEADLFAFELRHGVALPAEYRAFVLRVCNGRVGPDYGLYPLDLARTYEELRKPFPITPELAGTIAAAMKLSAPRGWSNVPQPDEDVWGSGYLELCEHGCGNASALVVNGPLRGQIWWQGDLGLVPDPTDPTAPLGFLAWYKQWLDRVLPDGAGFRGRL